MYDEIYLNFDGFIVINVHVLFCACTFVYKLCGCVRRRGLMELGNGNKSHYGVSWYA